MNRKHRLPMALALAMASSQALALGLGQVEVKSALYEPLVAEIPVLSSTPGEAESLTVRLASPDAFARVGLDRPPSLAANLEFSVGENARGQRVIRITTQSRVNDPFLSFLVEADWGRGRLVREFNLLLDPPDTLPAARTAAAAPVREAPAATPEPLEAPPPMPTPEVPSPAEAPATPAQASVPPAAPAQPAPRLPTPAPAPVDGDYSVAAGDTLWSIAQRTRPDAGVSVNRMMAALLQANPDAFIDGNINRIKRGAVLRIPDQGALQDTSEAQAGALVREQMDAWRSNRVPSLLPAEAQPAAAASPPQRAPQADSRLELVPPRGDQPAEDARSGMAASDGGSELRAELARTREDVSTRDQEIGELRSRVQELEQLRDDSQRLISMKDSELAALQRRLAELEAAAQAAPAAAVDPAAGSSDGAADAATADAALDGDAAGPAADPAAAIDGEGTEDAATPATAADAPAVVVPAPVEGTDAAGDPPAGAAPAADASVAAAAEPMPERGGAPWYSNLWFLGGIGLIVVGLLAWLLSRRRRGAVDAEPRGSSAGVLAAAAPARGRDDDHVDARADSATAREAALLDALAERPEDLERHLALARFYYEQGDADGFEGAAEAMYAQVYDPDNLMWKQVLAMGRELLPDHPLFAAHADGHDAAGYGETDVDEATLAAGANLDQARWNEDEGTGTDADDFRAASLQPSTGDDGHAYRAAGDHDSGDDGFGTPAQPAPVAPEPALHAEPAWDAADEATTQRFHVDDFADASQQDTFGSDASPAAAPQTSYEAPRGEPASFDYGADDAAATKLELARAYLDMGDVEGARGMLEEVMGEGNAGQRAEARRLLDEIR